MKYVVKSKRLKNYLYCLGFNYEEVYDRIDKDKIIWLFKNTEMLKDAITFFTENKRKFMNQQN